jgi:hypothetical protein
MNIKCFPVSGKHFFVSKPNIALFAGGLFGVEKVKPDPLNLSVHTVEGKHVILLNGVCLFRQAPYFFVKK